MKGNKHDASLNVDRGKKHLGGSLKKEGNLATKQGPYHESAKSDTHVSRKGKEKVDHPIFFNVSIGHS